VEVVPRNERSTGVQTKISLSGGSETLPPSTCLLKQTPEFVNGVSAMNFYNIILWPPS